MRRVTIFAVSTLGVGFLACGGTNPEPATPKPMPSASVSVSASASTAELPPIPVVPPEVDKTPASCAAFLAPPKPADPKPTEPPKGEKAKAKPPGVCATNASALVLDTVRAELAPMACAEAILTPALEAHGKEALPQHLAAARGLIGASRLARLRPKKGTFDLLARAEVDPKAADSAIAQVRLWKEALEKEESESAALAKSAPREIGALVRFEAAAAWIAFARELRATPYPTELAALSKKDKDLEVHYYGKLDEVTMPLLERARGIALSGIGMAVLDGVLVKDLPSFQQIVEPFKSRPGFEHRVTRDLELLPPDPLADKKAGDGVRVARFLPPWAAYAVLERVEPAALLTTLVLSGFAVHRGIPAALRLEIEKDKKLDDAHRGVIALARLRIALSYGSRPDAESIAGFKAKQPIDVLRVAIATALLGPSPVVAGKDDKKPPTPAAPGYPLAGLDALAKKPVIGAAAQFAAALLALENAQVFTGTPPDPMQPPVDPKKAYEDAIARLEAVAARKDLEAKHQGTARSLAESAKVSLKLLDKKP